MTRLLLLLAIPSFLFASCSDSSGDSLTSYVNPFIGTGGHGHTYPGATAPFGMVQLSPDSRLTGWDGCGGYHFTDSLIFGFSHTHLQGTGISDYGDILFMPTGSRPIFRQDTSGGPLDSYASGFSRKSEKAEPGFYSVFLDEPGTKVELTAGLRVGMQRYAFKSDGDQYVTLDLHHRDKLIDWKLEQVNEYELRGYRISEAWAEEQHVYFHCRFSAPVAEWLANSDPLRPAVISLRFDGLTELTICTGISATSMEGALSNLESEAGELHFDAMLEKTKEAWNKELSLITVNGGSEEQRRVFYTALYHSFTTPNLFSDADGSYRGMDGQIHQAPGHTQYTVFSLWDTFRSAHPLYNLVQPVRNRDFSASLMQHYTDGGKLSMWELAGNYTGCMIGYHSAPVLCDAWFKGNASFGLNTALEALDQTATAEELGKPFFTRNSLIEMGDEGESVSKMLEYAFDDWCIAEMAEAAGNSAMADRFYRRSARWRNILDPETGFMRPRRNGGWHSPFDPKEVNFNYTEANAWQYSFFVPHDIAGLIEMHGGTAAFERRLDSLFASSSELSGRGQPDITGMIGQYAHGNEPSHHMAFLYHYCGKPEKTIAGVSSILETQYSDAPDGLSGNEDCGQMSAWYVLASIGLYPVNPADTLYAISKPPFGEITIDLGGRTIRIEKEGNGDYFKSIRWNGEELNTPFISHQQLIKGGTLEIIMSDRNTGKSWEVPSVAEKPRDSTLPYLISDSQVYRDSLIVSIAHPDSSAELQYSLNGSEFQPYSGPLVLKDGDFDIRAFAVEPGLTASPEIRGSFYQRTNNWQVNYVERYDPQYPAGGEEALCDRLKGGLDFRTGLYQGFWGKDFSIILDLGEPETVRGVRAGFLRDIRPWIWLPKNMKVELSLDGQDYHYLGTVFHEESDRDYEVIRKELEVVFKPEKARYIRITAENYGVIPDWHQGAGGNAWIFVDEVETL